MISWKHRAAASELAGIPALARVPRRLLWRFEALSTPLSFPAGRVLMTEGGLGLEAFVIVDGTAAIVHRDGDTETTVAELGPGDIVGEMALLGNGRRTATVVATSPLQARVMSKREFVSVLELPGVAEAVRRTAAERVAA